MNLRHPLGGPRRGPKTPIEAVEYAALALLGVALLGVRHLPTLPTRRRPHA